MTTAVAVAVTAPVAVAVTAAMAPVSGAGSRNDLGGIGR